MLEVHPVANIFPMMASDEIDRLAADIEKNGQQEPVVLWNGQLIDGRNRVEACRRLGREPIRAELDFNEDPLQYVLSSNLHRRHLKTSQRAQCAAEVATLEVGRPSAEIQQNCRVSVEEAAALFSVSPRSVTSAKHVKDKGDPAVVEAVKQGAINVNLATKLVDAIDDAKEQRKLVQEGVAAIKQAVKPPEAQKKQQRANLEDSPQPELRKAISQQLNKLAVLRMLFDEMTTTERELAVQVWSDWQES